MKNALLTQLVKVLLPALAGAVGAYLLTSFPDVYHAVCAG